MYFMTHLIINMADRKRMKVSAYATVAVNDAGE